jgi:hypothetical protein
LIFLHTGRPKEGFEYSVNGVNIGCPSIYTWCPSGKPIEFFNWAPSSADPYTNQCLIVGVGAGSKLNDFFNVVPCTAKQQQFICMSK